MQKHHEQISVVPTMSLPEKRTVLGDCGHMFEARVWRSVNTSNPELLTQFLYGTLNLVACPTCGELTDVRSPFLFNDLGRNLMIFIYDPARGDEDPLPTLDPKLRTASAAIGGKMISADSFDAVRAALQSLDDPQLLSALRAQNPQSTDAQLCAEYINEVLDEYNETSLDDVAESGEGDATGQNESYAGEDPTEADLSPAERAKAIIEKHQGDFEAKQIEIIERLARHIPPEKTFREAFRESSQPGAPAPPGWWFVPALGLIIGLGLIKYAGRLGVGIGALLAIFTSILLVIGIFRISARGRTNSQ